ncbi:Glutaredoxin 1 [Carabus blaptoides fortunei]
MKQIQVSRLRVQQLINSDHIVIFSKTSCPYCKKTKNIFDSLNEENDRYTVYELDRRNDEELILNDLENLTGSRSVPRVFVNGRFIGGASEIQRMHDEGKLERILHWIKHEIHPLKNDNELVESENINFERPKNDKLGKKR